MPTDNQLIKAAKTRALLVAQVNSLTEPARATAILQPLQAQLAVIGTNDDAAIKILESAAKAGLITRIKDGRAVLFCKNGMAIPTAELEMTHGPKRKFTQLIETMTISDARTLYAQLHKMFGKG